MGRKKSKKSKYLSKDLIAAVTTNDVSRLKALHASGESFSAFDKNENSLLHIAIQAEESTIDAFEYLLTLSEISQDALNSNGNSFIMDAFGFTDSPEYVLKIIQSGCDLNHSFPDGNTILHLAVQNNWMEVAELLIEVGFNVDCQNDDKATALHIAAKLGHFDIVWMLLFFGADPNITFVSEIDYMDGSAFTYLTFFDLIHNSQELIHQLSPYDKNFSLSTFMFAMEYSPECFCKLMEITYDINYTYDDLKEFSQRFSLFKPELLKLFIQKFDYVMEEMLYRCSLEDLFFCEDRVMLQNYSQNLFSLLETDIIHSLVEVVNSSKLSLLGLLVQSFTQYRDQIDLLTKIFCYLLSYGVNMTPDAMNTLFISFGYCELFKISLHMNIEQCKRWVPSQYILARVIYDTNLKFNYIIFNETCDQQTCYKLMEYFTFRKLKVNVENFRVPTLLELARNATREYIIDRFSVKNSMQFYTILKALPVAQVHRKIISLEKKLYT